MKEDIEYLQRFINRCKKSGSEFYGILKPGHFESLQNLINKYKEQEKIIELMADKIYKTTDTLNMLDIGKEINYDLEKLFNGIEDKEAIKIIIEYFKKKAKSE